MTVLRLILIGIVILFSGIALVSLQRSIEEREQTEAALIALVNPGCKFECVGIRGLGRHIWMIQGPSNLVEAVVKDGDVVVTKEFFVGK